jgi:putative transposase
VIAARDEGWRVSDALWERIEPLLPQRPQHRYGGHNPRIGDRDAVDGIFYVLRSGSPWSALNQTRICSKSSAYRRFREWAAAGVFEALWRALLADPQLTLDWDWLALDGQIVKAPYGGQATGPNPTDRAKRGTKRSVCTEAQGIPVAIVIDGANRNDFKLLEATLTGVDWTLAAGARRALCLDKGYDYPACRQLLHQHGLEAHIRCRGEERQRRTEGHRARRWVIERTFAWFNRFRRLMTSWERLHATRLALLHFAAALITWRRTHPVTRAEATY